MSDSSSFRSDVMQIIEKYEKQILQSGHQELASDLLNDINELLSTHETKFQDANNSLKAKFKDYVVSTLKFSSLSKMISGVAHEINTPLAIIQIRTDQLVEATVANEFSKDTFEKSLTSIDQTAKRIGSIVTRLRTYARSLDTKDISRVSLKKLIEDTAALTRDRFLTDGITLEIETPVEDCEIDCCASDISQALLNMLNNSFTALHQHSEKWIRISYFIKDHSVLINVTDPGPGISLESRSQIFDPFFTLSKDQSHLGLGLTIARDYALAHQGNLILDESSPLTQFTITLPLPDTNHF